MVKVYPERHDNGTWRVRVGNQVRSLPEHLNAMEEDRTNAIYRLLDIVARSEYFRGDDARRIAAQVASESGERVLGKYVHRCGDDVAKELNLDVQAEQARALHRVVRAMHDGHCPNCGHLDTAESFMSHVQAGNNRRIYHVCGRCEFTVTDGEAAEALAAFAPFLKKSVAIFKEWRSERARKLGDKITSGFTEFADSLATDSVEQNHRVTSIPVERRMLERGNVVRVGVRKKVILKARVIEEDESFVCSDPHEDGDYSYLCNDEYCQCHS